MTAPLSSPQLTQVANELAADSRSLDALKRDAQRDPHGAMRKAAQQFEALFMQMVLKSMREARSEEHTSELSHTVRAYAVFCL